MPFKLLKFKKDIIHKYELSLQNMSLIWNCCNMVDNHRNIYRCIPTCYWISRMTTSTVKFCRASLPGCKFCICQFFQLCNYGQVIHFSPSLRIKMGLIKVLLGILWKLNELICVKHLQKCLLMSDASINVSCYCHYNY